MGVKILKSIQTIIVFFKISGLWPNHKKHYVLYMIYAAIFQFIFTFCYVIFKFIIFFYLTEVHLITKTLFLWLGEAAFVLKVFNFHFYNNEMQQLLVTIKDFQIKNNFESDLLKRRQRMFNKIAACYVGCAGIAVFFSLVSPLFSAERQLPLAKPFQMITSQIFFFNFYLFFRYPSWYPIDWRNNTFNYCILYAYQVIGIFFMAFAIILLETFAVYLMIMTSIHTDILAMRFERLGEQTTNDDMNEIEAHRRDHFLLIECFQVYNTVSR